jgi:4-nitrophenyl phosphatase
LASWSAFLIDLDGTLYHGSRIIPHADQLIYELNHCGKPYLFVTNNSSRTPEEVALHLRGMGIPALQEQVCTSAVAAADYIKRTKPSATVAPIGEHGLMTALHEANVSIEWEKPDIVVQGIDRSFTYETLSKAMNWIANGAEFILTNPDLMLPTKEGFAPGAGTLGAAIEAATGKKPTIIGKPSRILMEYAIHKLQLPNDQVAMIGDNMLTDISAGANVGCGTILTLTGVTNANNLESFEIRTNLKADVICNDLAEVIELIRA